MFEAGTTNVGPCKAAICSRISSSCLAMCSRLAQAEMGPRLSRHHHARPAGPGQPCTADPAAAATYIVQATSCTWLSNALTSHRDILAAECDNLRRAC